MLMPKHNLLLFNNLQNRIHPKLSDYGHAVYGAGLYVYEILIAINPFSASR
jgi:hypothetical protein